MNFSIPRIVLAGAVAVFLICFLVAAPPNDFPSGSIITIAQGTPAPLVAKELADVHIIAHPTILKFLLRVSGKSDTIRAGTYLFKAPQNLLTVAYRIITGDYGIPLTRITFPEGTAMSDMAEQVVKAFPAISAADFVDAGMPYEGYLFPDTYFFPATIDAESIVKAMRANFNTKIAGFSGDITTSGHSISDIVTMASLIEKEARTSADKRMVAGILWHRMILGMALQVDASRETYAHVGLPPIPICNPGLDSIDAALHPTKTNYLYYLSDKNGAIHYATTYAEQQANQKKYLD